MLKVSRTFWWWSWLLLAGSLVPLLPDTVKALQPLRRDDESQLRVAVSNYFQAGPEQQVSWTFPPRLNALLREHESSVREIVWSTWLEVDIHGLLREDFEARQVRFESHLSPYTVKTVGTRPENGWPLFIAMHGGGGAPKRVNDSQWQVMQRYYRDHAEIGGYLYLALRAPNDTWNGFYDDYVYPLMANLIRQFVLFGEVDPNKVFLMGYSHGGYGAFAIGPKMPDRFAAVHSSAAAPTDGESTPVTLRNTPFTFMIGEKDTMYGRLERCRAFDRAVRDLRGSRTDIYPVLMEYKPGHGHTGLPDRDKIPEMYPALRNPVPRELSWEMTDSVITDFYWLRVPNPSKQQRLDAAFSGNELTATGTNIASGSIFLDHRLVDLRKPLIIRYNGNKARLKLQPSLRTLCETLARRGDPGLAFTCEVSLPNLKQVP